jgi:hypothetical protein
MELGDKFSKVTLEGERQRTNMEVLRNPLQLSALSIALLQSESFDTLLAISSKPVHDRLICFDGVNIFIWSQFLDLNQLIYNIDYKKTEIPYYKVLDDETIKCIVGFHTGHQIIAVFLLYKENGIWNYHDIQSFDSLDCFKEFCGNWFKSQMLAKIDFGEVEMKDEHDDYWDSYMDEKVDVVQELKRPMEEDPDEVLDDVDYWDQY